MHRSILSGTGFFRIWAGESISLAGSQVTAFALPLVAVITLKANAVEMGLLMASESLAALLLAPALGAWADWSERRLTMIIANLGRLALLALIPACYFLGILDLPVLLLAAFGVGALSLLFESAMSSYVPPLVGQERLIPANSWMQGSGSVAETAGPGLAGLLVQFLGAPLAIAVDALSYLASTVALLASPVHRIHTGDDERESIRAAIRHGMRAIFANPVQRSMVMAAAHFNFFTSMFFALYMLFLVRTLHFSPLLIGLLNIAGGAAGLIAAAISSRLANRFGHGPVITMVYGLPGAAALLVPLASMAGSVGGAVLVGVSSGFWAGSVAVNLILSETVKQAMIAPELLGRATATFRFATLGVEPFGAMAGAGLASAPLGMTGTLVLASAGIGSSAIWLVLSRVGLLRDLTPAADEPTSLSPS